MIFDMSIIGDLRPDATVYRPRSSRRRPPATLADREALKKEMAKVKTAGKTKPPGKKKVSPRKKTSIDKPGAVKKPVDESKTGKAA